MDRPTSSIQQNKGNQGELRLVSSGYLGWLSIESDSLPTYLLKGIACETQGSLILGMKARGRQRGAHPVSSLRYMPLISRRAHLPHKFANPEYQRCMPILSIEGDGSLSKAIHLLQAFLPVSPCLIEDTPYSMKGNQRKRKRRGRPPPLYSRMKRRIVIQRGSPETKGASTRLLFLSSLIPYQPTNEREEIQQQCPLRLILAHLSIERSILRPPPRYNNNGETKRGFLIRKHALHKQFFTSRIDQPKKRATRQKSHFL